MNCSCLLGLMNTFLITSNNYENTTTCLSKFLIPLLFNDLRIINENIISSVGENMTVI